MGYLHQVFPLTILAQNDAYLPWFYSQYIQVHCPFDLTKGRFDFYRPLDAVCVPDLSHLQVPREMMAPWGVISMVRDCIDRDTYVWSRIDSYYISRLRAFQSHHVGFEMLIYGYDD